MDKISGIYCIENIINNKKYIGQSININVRMNKKHEKSYVLNSAIEKYGIENFKSYILEICSPDILDEREIYWIKELNSHSSENGYNISWGGNAPMKGRKVSDETKKKLRDSKLGEKCYLFNTKHPKEIKDKISKSNTGKKKRNKKPNTSDYLGVSYEKNLSKWRVRIKIKGKSIHIGVYFTEKEAAYAYNSYLIDNNLDYPLNIL